MYVKALNVSLGNKFNAETCELCNCFCLFNQCSVFASVEFKTVWRTGFLCQNGRTAIKIIYNENHNQIAVSTSQYLFTQTVNDEKKRKRKKNIFNKAEEILLTKSPWDLRIEWWYVSIVCSSNREVFPFHKKVYSMPRTRRIGHRILIKIALRCASNCKTHRTSKSSYR